MSWDFFLPVRVADLMKNGGINQYVVQEVVPPKQLPSSVTSKLSNLVSCPWNVVIVWNFHLRISFHLQDLSQLSGVRGLCVFWSILTLATVCYSEY